MRSETGLVAAIDWQTRRAELPALLDRQARLYAMGETSSLPVETVRELLESIRFCVEAGFVISTDAQQSPLEQLFQAGRLEIWRRTEQGKELLHLAAETDPGYGSVSLHDTLEELAVFFRVYDLRFFAHDIPCMIDYPLFRPVPEDRLGILYIDEYLQKLTLENRFCRCFAKHAATRMLEAQQPLYRELVWNLFEPVFACAVGHALLGADSAPLHLDREQCLRLHDRLRPLAGGGGGRTVAGGREPPLRAFPAVGHRDARLSAGRCRFARSAAPHSLPGRVLQPVRLRGPGGQEGMKAKNSNPDQVFQSCLQYTENRTVSEMESWYRQIQTAVDVIDIAIAQGDDERLTLGHLAGELGYSPFHMTRIFRALTGMPLRDYLRRRRLAFALVEVRDSDKTLLQIAVEHGFSSHEAFTRAFKGVYGLTPTAYRRRPVPVVLRSKLTTLDRYLLGQGEIGMLQSGEELKVYFTRVPAHKFLHIKNYGSHGYFDFWDKQAAVPGQDCDTICGLLDSIRGKLDGDDGVMNQYSGQIMGYPQEPDGRVPEAYGVRLAPDWAGEIPPGMLLLDITEGEYIVFEHGPFDFETQNMAVFEQLESAIAGFDWADSDGRAPDKSPGRIGYYYNDPSRFLKRVLPVVGG